MKTPGQKDRGKEGRVDGRTEQGSKKVFTGLARDLISTVQYFKKFMDIKFHGFCKLSSSTFRRK